MASRKEAVKEGKSDGKGLRFFPLVGEDNIIKETIANDRIDKEIVGCEEDAINNIGHIDLVPETQMGPLAQKPIQDPGSSNSKYVSMQKSKLCQNQHVRNARGGKNPPTSRKRNIKAMAKQSFKRSSSSVSKPISKSEEGRRVSKI